MKNLFCYNVCNTLTSLGSSNVRVIMSIPISRFKKTDGCINSGNASKLTDDDIGERFEMEMLDPIQPGVVTYLGRTFNAIPKGKFKKSLTPSKIDFLNDDWRVFKKSGRNACIIVVMAYKCNVTPV